MRENEGPGPDETRRDETSSMGGEGGGNNKNGGSLSLSLFCPSHPYSYLLETFCD